MTKLTRKQRTMYRNLYYKKMEDYLEKTIGEKAANDFVNFIKLNKKLPTSEEASPELLKFLRGERP